MTAVRHRIEIGLALTLRTLGRVIGRRLGRLLGRAVGTAWYLLGKHHRRVALANLARAFPERPPAARAAIARGSFRHFGELSMDLALFMQDSGRKTRDQAVVDGWEHLERAHARGRGVLVISAHFGHWEQVALVQAARGLPMDIVTRPLGNAALERYVTRVRSHSGNRLIHKEGAVQNILTSLREGRIVGMVIDQNYRGSRPFFVDFFGHPAATTPTLGLVAVRTGAPVIPVFSWRRDDGRYHIVYMSEVPIDSTGKRNTDAHRLTRDCTRIIEEQIRLRPELWSWMHERWKTRRERRVERPGAETTGPLAGP